MFWAGSLAVVPASLTNNSRASGWTCPTRRFGLPRVPDANKGCHHRAGKAPVTPSFPMQKSGEWEGGGNRELHCHLPAMIIEDSRDGHVSRYPRFSLAESDIHIDTSISARLRRVSYPACCRRSATFLIYSSLTEAQVLVHSMALLGCEPAEECPCPSPSCLSAPSIISSSHPSPLHESPRPQRPPLPTTSRASIGTLRPE